MMGIAMLAAAAMVAASGTSPRMPVDSGPAAPACAPLAERARVDPAVAADVRASLQLHGAVVRWAADRPLRVWIARRPWTLAPDRHADAEWRLAVLAGAAGWASALSGVAFVPARDSAPADVHVRWVPTLTVAAAGDGAESALAARAAGRTALRSDSSGRVAGAVVVLAMSAPDGTPYSLRDVRAVAQHEVGHVLGLVHHASPSSVMAPLVGANALTAADRATLALLYRLPIGARCNAPPADRAASTAGTGEGSAPFDAMPRAALSGTALSGAAMPLAVMPLAVMPLAVMPLAARSGRP